MKENLRLKAISRLKLAEKKSYQVMLYNSKFIATELDLFHTPPLSRYAFVYEYFGNYFESLEEAENRAKFLEKEYKKWKRRKNG